MFMCSLKARSKDCNYVVFAVAKVEAIAGNNKYLALICYKQYITAIVLNIRIYFVYNLFVITISSQPSTYYFYIIIVL